MLLTKLVALLKAGTWTSSSLDSDSESEPLAKKRDMVFTSAYAVFCNKIRQTYTQFNWGVTLD